jgi:hypothetical protein
MSVSCPAQSDTYSARGAPNRLLRNAAGLLATLLLASCEQASLPAAPSEVTSGLTLYEHANYLGTSALLTRSSGDLSDFSGPCEHTESGGSTGSTTTYDWQDCVSSVRIAPGWRATLYRDRDYKGQSVEVTADLPNLQLVPGSCDHDGLNDCVSSIKLVPPAFQ